MKQVVSSLKGFARLDEAELQRSDVREGLEATLALIDRVKYGGVEIVKEFSEVPDIECRPQGAQSGLHDTVTSTARRGGRRPIPPPWAYRSNRTSRSGSSMNEQQATTDSRTP